MTPAPGCSPCSGEISPAVFAVLPSPLLLGSIPSAVLFSAPRALSREPSALPSCVWMLGIRVWLDDPPHPPERYLSQAQRSGQGEMHPRLHGREWSHHRKPASSCHGAARNWKKMGSKLSLPYCLFPRECKVSSTMGKAWLREMAHKQVLKQDWPCRARPCHGCVRRCSTEQPQNCLFSGGNSLALPTCPQSRGFWQSCDAHPRVGLPS